MALCGVVWCVPVQCGAVALLYSALVLLGCCASSSLSLSSLSLSLNGDGCGENANATGSLRKTVQGWVGGWVDELQVVYPALPEDCTYRRGEVLC